MTLACASPAAAVPVGILSFDPFIPGASNAFNIANLSESFSLPPDFPVVDPLTFAGAQLTVSYEDLSTTLFDLGDIGPGFVDNPVLQFADSIAFASATLTFTLSSLHFALDDGSTFEAASSLVSVSLLPSTGSLLAPGELVVIDVEGAPVTTVPEPGTALLLGASAMLWCGARKRRMKAS